MSLDSSEFSNGQNKDVLLRSPEALLLRIRDAFTELGILGTDLSLKHDGIWYRISCDEKSFMVYRVNANSGSRHHMPGWPVCLVNSLTIFEECYSPGLGRDHYACEMDIDNWLALVNRHCTNKIQP